MHMETAKKIYPTEAVANMIAGKLTKVRQKKYIVMKVTTGWQVAPVTTCPSAVPPWPPAPYPVKGALQPNGALYKKPSTSGVSKATSSASHETATVKIACTQETPKYIGVMLDGKEAWIGKSTLISYAIVDGMATMQMPMAIAKKRGLLGHQVKEAA